MHIIGIDPSINTTGIAILKKGPPLEIFTKEIKTPGLSIQERISKFQLEYRMFMQVVPHHTGLVKVVIEQPEYHTGLTGQMAVERGDIVKLCTAFGAWLQIVCSEISYMDIHLATPSKWKGQVPKNITRKRLLDKYPKFALELKAATHNEIDALGLADWLNNEIQSPSDRKTA